jgi:hypothetical protein
MRWGLLPCRGGLLEVVASCLRGTPFVGAPLCGPGIVGWIPVDPSQQGQLTLTAVPTTPTLEVIKPPTGTATIQVSFEAQQLQLMTLTRQWRVEKSTDLMHWAPVKTVALGQFSPILINDQDSIGQATCYYRAVMVEDLMPTREESVPLRDHV